MDFEREIAQLKDTAVVMAEIQRRQAQVQKDQAEVIEGMSIVLGKMREGFEQHEKRMQHIDLTLSEIGDKLNGLIGYMDSQRREPPQ